MKNLIKLLFIFYFFLVNTSLNAENIKIPIYDTTGYLNKNKANQSFFIPMKILFQDMLLPHGPDVIDTIFLTNYAKRLPNSKIPYILDIECWDIRPKVNDEEANKNIDKYILVIKTLKEARPDLKFGYFGVLPVRDYVSYGTRGKAQLERWNYANIRAKRLAQYTDIIVPEFYMYINDVNHWKNYTILAMKEARMYGKPVLPFIWPEYMDSGQNLKLGIAATFMDSNIWRQQLVLLDKLADGIIVWGGRNVLVNPHTSRMWDEDAKWWVETKNLILENKQTDPAAIVKDNIIKKDLSKAKSKIYTSQHQDPYLPTSIVLKPTKNPKFQSKKIEIIKE